MFLESAQESQLNVSFQCSIAENKVNQIILDKM